MNFDEWLNSVKSNTTQTINSLTNLEWSSFEDCKYFYSCVKLTEKHKLIVFLDYIRQLAPLPNIQYGEAKFKTETHPKFFISALRVSMKFTKDIGFFDDPTLDANDDYCEKWLLFCIKIMNPACKILSPNVKFQNDQRLAGHLIGVDPNKTIMKIIFNSVTKTVPAKPETKTSIVAPQSNVRRKKKPDFESKFAKGNPLLTLHGRLFDRSRSVSFETVREFLDLSGVKCDSSIIEEQFLNSQATSHNIISLMSLMNLEINIIFFSVVKADTPSARVFNIVSLDSIMNDHNPKLIFVLKTIENDKLKHSIIPEEKDDSKINMKVYQDSRIDVTNHNSYLNVLNPSIVFKNDEREQLLQQGHVKMKESFKISSASLNWSDLDYSYYDLCYNYVNDKSFTAKRSKFFYDIDHFSVIMSDIFGLSIPPDAKDVYTIINRVYKRLAHSNMSCTFFILFTMDSLKDASKLRISDIFISGYHMSSETSFWILGKDFIIEIIRDQRVQDLKISLDNKHSVKLDIISQTNTNEINSVYLRLFQDFKNWNVVNFIKDSILTSNKVALEEMISYLRSNCLISSERDFLSITHDIEYLFNKTTFDYFFGLEKLENVKEILMPKKLKELTEEEESLKHQLSVQRFRISHPNLDSFANIKKYMLNNFPDLSTDSFIKRRLHADEALEEIMNFQLDNGFYYEFAIFYVISFEDIHRKIVYDCRKIMKTLNYSPDSCPFMYDINKKRLFHLVPDLRGTFKIDFSMMDNFMIIDNSSHYGLVNKNLKLRDTSHLTFFEKGILNFFSLNNKFFKEIISDDILKFVLMDYDKRLKISGLNPEFEKFYTKKTTQEDISSKIAVVNLELDFIEKSYKTLKNFNMTEEEFKSFWFKFTYTDEEKNLFDVIAEILNRKMILSHPAKNMAEFFMELNLLIKGKLEMFEKNLNTEKDKLKTDLTLSIMKTTTEVEKTELFLKTLKTIETYLETQNIVKPNEFDDFLIKDLKIYDVVRKFESSFNHPESNPSYYFDIFYDTKNCSSFKRFIEIYLTHTSHKVEFFDYKISFEDQLIEHFNRDSDFSNFKDFNETLRKCLSVNFNNFSDLIFLSDYTNTVNKYFILKNKSFNVVSYNINYKIALSNFMSWTHLRHDFLSLLLIKNLFPSLKSEEFDDSFGNHFTSLSRTPDLILENSDKTKLLIVEFTYSHNHLKGTLAKGFSIESSKYYPEIYSIFNSELYEEVFYLPIVFSKFLSDANDKFFSETVSQMKTLEKEGFQISTFNFEVFKKAIVKATEIFLESTDLIYKPNCLFNSLISKKNRFSFNINEKYTCVEYNAEAVDNAFSDKESIRKFIHLIFGKYLFRDLSRDALINIIKDYQRDPLMMDDTEIEFEDFDRIPIHWLIKIFNDVVFSFSLKEFSLIHKGKLNFYKEFYKRIQRVFDITKPTSAPYFADNNFILNELYQRLIISNISNFSPLLSINHNNFPSLRHPRVDIYSYYRHPVKFKNPKNCLNKVVKDTISYIALDREEAVYQFNIFKSKLDSLKIEISHNYYDHLIDLFFIMENSENFSEVSSFFDENFSYLRNLIEGRFKLKSKSEYFLSNYENSVVKLYEYYQTLFVFSRFSDYASEILYKKGVLNRSIEEFKDSYMYTLSDYNHDEMLEQKKKQQELSEKKKKYDKYNLSVEPIDYENLAYPTAEKKEKEKEKEDENKIDDEVLESLVKINASIADNSSKKEEDILIQDEDSIKATIKTIGRKLRSKLKQFSQFQIKNISYEEEQANKLSETKKKSEILRKESELNKPYVLQHERQEPEEEQDPNFILFSISDYLLPKEVVKMKEEEKQSMNFKFLSLTDYEANLSLVKLDSHEVDPRVVLIGEEDLDKSRVEEISKRLFKWESDFVSLNDMELSSRNNNCVFILTENIIQNEYISDEFFYKDIKWCVNTEKLHKNLCKLLFKRKFLYNFENKINEILLDEYNIIAHNLILILSNWKENNSIQYYLETNDKNAKIKYEFHKLVSSKKNCDKINYNYIESQNKVGIYNVYDLLGNFESEQKNDNIIIKKSFLLDHAFKSFFDKVDFPNVYIFNRDQKKAFYLFNKSSVYYSKETLNHLTFLTGMYPIEKLSGMILDVETLKLMIEESSQQDDQLITDLGEYIKTTESVKPQSFKQYFSNRKIDENSEESKNNIIQEYEYGSEDLLYEESLF